MPDQPRDPSGPDEPRERELGTSLEQFRQALTRPLARVSMGLDIGDEEAELIASDESLSVLWYNKWLEMAHTPRGRASTSGPPPAVSPGTAQRDVPAWDLPMRFNRPPGWSEPTRDWVVEHIGRDLSSYSRPPGAPLADLTGWLWWSPRSRRGRSGCRVGSVTTDECSRCSVSPSWRGWESRSSVEAELRSSQGFAPPLLASDWSRLGWSIGHFGETR